MLEKIGEKNHCGITSLKKKKKKKSIFLLFTAGVSQEEKSHAKVSWLTAK